MHQSYHKLYTVAVDDFIPINNMEVVFSPTVSEECEDVTILDDGLFEDPETFIVTITPTDSNLLNVFRSQASITIISENSKFNFKSNFLGIPLQDREQRIH